MRITNDYPQVIPIKALAAYRYKTVINTLANRTNVRNCQQSTPWTPQPHHRHLDLTIPPIAAPRHGHKRHLAPIAAYTTHVGTYSGIGDNPTQPQPQPHTKPRMVRLCSVSLCVVQCALDACGALTGGVPGPRRPPIHT